MNTYKNSVTYRNARSRAVLFFAVSLFFNFMKSVMLLIDVAAFCASSFLAFLFMTFGYFGVVARNPCPTIATVYTGAVVLDILMNVLLSYTGLNNINTFSKWDVEYWAHLVVDRKYFYMITGIVISVCALSTLFNSLAIIYVRRFKKVVERMPVESDVGTPDINDGSISISIVEDNTPSDVPKEEEKQASRSKKSAAFSKGVNDKNVGETRRNSIAISGAAPQDESVMDGDNIPNMDHEGASIV
ncbi:hypothetical protein POVWA2_047990 [Plasmodium ovale wallikeri]|uniref:Uncharacterized protein n=2 Tax=Plasmodium ovale TaxID=36330 RepID=A0A1A8ZJA5_PLAOA|nr:hypothetical protein POVWA1_048930 [Plasmodium ovale wallikeri]SBT44487.1 hypothetical protein POVWA2_047990 [Plasmodium ovale wallikeri]SBT78601.1 conserved Plasmodium protein, unknown function [Plasmodium ovale]